MEFVYNKFGILVPKEDKEYPNIKGGVSSISLNARVHPPPRIKDESKFIAAEVKRLRKRNKRKPKQGEKDGRSN